MTPEAVEQVEEYKRKVKKMLKFKAPDKIKELSPKIEGYIEHCIEFEEAETIAEVQTVLQRLGAPEVIADRFLLPLWKRSWYKANDLFNKPLPPWVVITVIGSAFTITAIFFIGALLLCISPWWSKKSKAIAILIPVPTALVFLLLGPPVNTMALVFMRIFLSLILSPLLSAGYLWLALPRSLKQDPI